MNLLYIYYIPGISYTLMKAINKQNLYSHRVYILLGELPQPKLHCKCYAKKKYGMIRRSWVSTLYYLVTKGLTEGLTI